ncbi:MAG: preprotein translocase subunit SecG [Candidatus Harrisonbacteria bacterium]|nr:preprotein translocase subunit SecG [Candidatus Harrisonbacteria bacterium]
MNIIDYIQIAISVVVITLILLQERGAGGLGGAFGGSDTGGFYQARRGMEKMFFWATLILVIGFAGLALLNLVV